MLRRIVLLFLFVLIFTTWTIWLHTPVFPPFTFEISCPSSALPCSATISEDQKQKFRSEIDNAIRASHRLGKLSDVYISIMSFQHLIQSKADAYISVPSTKTSRHVFPDMKCGDTAFKYNSVRLVNSDFRLSDSPADLLETDLAFIRTCESFSFNQEPNNAPIVVPPNEIVTFDVGPKFLPILNVDCVSWILVFIFNFLITTGLLPILREAARWLQNGMHYFA